MSAPGSEGMMCVLEDMTGSCQRSLDVLDELLSVEQLDSGLTLLTRTSISLDTLLSDAMQPLRAEVQCIQHITHFCDWHFRSECICVVNADNISITRSTAH